MIRMVKIGYGALACAREQDNTTPILTLMVAFAMARGDPNTLLLLRNHDHDGNATLLSLS